MSLSAVHARTPGTARGAARRDWALVGVAIGSAVTAVVIDTWSRSSGTDAAALSRGFAAVYGLAAGLVVLVAMLDRARRDPARRRPMRMLAIGGALLFGGQGVGYLLTLSSGTTYDVRIEAIPLLLAFPFALYAIAVVCWPSGMTRADTLIVVTDSLVAILSLAVLWWLVVVPEWQHPEHAWEHVDQWLMFGGFCLVLLVAVASRGITSLPFTQVLLVLTGLGTYFVADTLAQTLRGGDDTTNVTYSIVGYAVAAAVLVATAHRPAVEVEPKGARLSRERLAATTPLVMTFVAFVVVVRYATDELGAAQQVATIALLVTLLTAIGLTRFTAAAELRRVRAESVASVLADRTREGWFRALIGDAGDGVLVLDALGDVVYLSPRAAEMFASPGADDAAASRQLADLLVDTDVDHVRMLLAQVSLDASLAGPYDLLAHGAHGRQLEIEATVRPVTDVEFEGFVVTARDVTTSRRLARQLANSRRRDELTGLLTREAFLTELADRLGRTATPSHAAVVVLDLERFAALNDGLGRETGDLILAAVARSFDRLPDSVRVTARLSSDAFAWLVDAHDAEPAVGEVVEQCRRDLLGLLLADGREVELSFRAGYVVVDAVAPQPSDWYLEAADMALSRARTSRRSRLVAYDERMRVDIERRLADEAVLRRALAGDGLEAWFQPIVRLADNVVVGAEALARVRTSDGRIVVPDTFIPLAEELGLIHGLGLTMLRQACARTAEITARTGSRLRVAVNVAADQLTSLLPAEVAAALAESGLSAEQLTVEITESTLADQSARTQQVLDEIRALGVAVSLDDFGTGYSSMSYLARLPVAGLKIDRSFVTVLGSSPDGLTLARMVVQLANSLGLSTVAEGVETVEQADLLRGMGCEFGQGYLYARPMPFEEYVEFLGGALTARAVVTD